MAKTLVEKISSPTPDVSIFKISGTLGYHENKVISRFFDECRKKDISQLILDFSELKSLGGGCAKIIREAAASGTIAVAVVGGSTTVRNFLEREGHEAILFEPHVDAALGVLGEIDAARFADPALPDPEVAMAPATDAPVEASAGRPGSCLPKSEAFEGNPSETAVVVAEEEQKKSPEMAPVAEVPTAVGHREQFEQQAKELQRKIVQYRSLLSLNNEFNGIREKARLLDAFLLTTIAQVGVESAAFLELRDDRFVAISWKGFETADPGSLNVAASEVDSEKWLESPRIYALGAAPLTEEAVEHLKTWDMPYIAPFVVCDGIRALVLLGSPIRHELDDESWDFLSVLINQATVAYDNSCRYEEEARRTLGLVHSLISMIEENTLSRDSTERLVDYAYALAVALHYPEDHLRDLIYGAVLRDIGMIKVSELILRSPRELSPEQWEIIKRHPLDGAKMLDRMKFSAHTVDIVRCHHERSNGEGYPDRLQGSQIPLGARIVSVAESYTAMLSDRPTRSALTPEEALNTLRDNWGDRYDDEVVARFAEIIEDEIRTGEHVRYEGSQFLRTDKVE